MDGEPYEDWAWTNASLTLNLKEGGHIFVLHGLEGTLPPDFIRPGTTPSFHPVGPETGTQDNREAIPFNFFGLESFFNDAISRIKSFIEQLLNFHNFF
jgi:hypothetical protein